MKLSGQTLSYLEGEKFSNSLQIPYSYKQPIPDRVEFLTELAAGKNIIHLGCLDHQPLIADKISRGQWLHKNLTEHSARCLGIDIDEDTKKYVESQFGYDNIIIGDFIKDQIPQISEGSWDYAILGEILEHIDNPVAFLSAIKARHASSVKRIIVTVPNAWTRTTMRMAKKSIEIINSDHRYWFTPYTLSKVLIEAGMQLEDIYFANRVPLTVPELVYKKLLSFLGKKSKYNFTYASSIVAVARLSD